jgi:hypothetical protein
VHRLVFLAALATLPISCRAGPKPTVIAGHISLTTEQGAVEAVDSRVRLLRRSDSLVAALAAVCRDYEQRFRAIEDRMPTFLRHGKPDRLWVEPMTNARATLAIRRPIRLERAGRRWGSGAPRTMATQAGLDSLEVLLDRTEANVNGVLIAAAVRAGAAGPEAPYRFDSLPPGPYVVWAQAHIGDNDYTWWAETLLVSGDSVWLDLDPSREAGTRLYCNIR